MTGKAPQAAASAAAAPPPGGRRLTGVFGAEAANGRLDRALASSPALAGAGLSRSRIKALILEGRVSLGGATISDPSSAVKPGQRFAVLVPEARPAIPEPQPIALD